VFVVVESFVKVSPGAEMSVAPIDAKSRLANVPNGTSMTLSLPAARTLTVIGANSGTVSPAAFLNNTPAPIRLSCAVPVLGPL